MNLTCRLLQRHAWKKTLTTSAAAVQSSQSLSFLIEKYSRYCPTPLSMKQFIDFAQKTGDENSSFRWLRQEIPTRLANMIKEMNRLPDELLSTSSTSLVTSWYNTSFEEMMQFRNSPVNHSTIENFTQSLKGVVERHRNVVETMAHGIMEWSEHVLGADGTFSDTDKENIQYFLDRFYTSRIGIRLLINQHILLFGDSPNRSPDLYGSIDPNCDVGAVVQDAYDNAKFLCEQYYLGAPDMEIDVKNAVNNLDPTVNIIYAPSHLYHVCFELFKNAMRATMEHHPEHACDVPSVSVRVTKGQHDCCIRISDNGGGASRETRQRWFEYLYSTAPRPPRSTDSRVAPLAGYGYGLPISRLYARYLGGDLQIQSMEGSGTDAYIYLRSLSSEAIETVPVFNSTTTEQYRRSHLSGDWVIPANSAVQAQYKNSFNEQSRCNTKVNGA
ncbi:pyruvate dehydrogenase (acetyl-transferring) kinase isozyme 2, mitochondrial-like [Styela clava]|uniref:pyruvate dehydrogenase (acetyl-transferring) kinase isozyme 2, mitochondrial-like n=1 Tax=Styela clava TaxID=7725 RepID=UPI001939BBE2|nr:pyruvate dehydrogenase (acetyl-transferring) kinase isozyme 2, mitochondrial-like [Styela clava]